MRNLKGCLALSLFALIGAIAGVSQAAPQVGWYWNPAQSGRGFFIESLDDQIYMAGYLYDASGHAMWAVAGGPNKDPYNYSGPLIAVSGGQTLTGTYQPPTSLQDLGPMSLHFTDDTHAILTWPGETIPLQREIFGSGTPAFKPQTGWWWNPAESGRGYNIEVQGNALFFIGSMYEQDGRPVWYLSAGPVGQDPSTYSGPLLQLADGQSMGGPYQLPVLSSSVGTVDIAFNADNSGTITVTRNASSELAKDGSQQTTTIVPEFNQAEDFDPPNWIIGSFVEVATLTGVNLPAGATASERNTYHGDRLTWQLHFIDGGTQVATYILRGGQFTIDLEGQSQVVVPDVGTATCVQSSSGIAPVSFPFTSSSVLTLDAHSHYELTIALDQLQIPVQGTLTCVGPGGGVLDDIPPMPLPATPANLNGLFGVAVTAVDELFIYHELPSETGLGPLGSVYTLTGSYDFTGGDDCNTEFCPPPDAKTAAVHLGAHAGGGTIAGAPLHRTR